MWDKTPTERDEALLMFLNSAEQRFYFLQISFGICIFYNIKSTEGAEICRVDLRQLI